MEHIGNHEEPLRIALEMLTERCKKFEQRVIDVEKENARLKLICSRTDDTRDSLNELDTLKQKNAQLREHNTQLKSNIQMVANENRQLWAKLTNLMEVNEKLGSKLSKINDSIVKHHTNMTESIHTTPLIRSKTFTQNDSHSKYQQKNIVDENTKISLELEDISLKLISNIAKEKNELEAQYKEMVELQGTESCNAGFGFAYPGDNLEESTLEALETHVDDMKLIKETVMKQKEMLLYSINKLKEHTVEKICQECKERELEKEVVMSKDILNKHQESYLRDDYKLAENTNNKEDNKLMCPMCSKIFPKETQLSELENHVEQHFLTNEGINNFVIMDKIELHNDI